MSLPRGLPRAALVVLLVAAVVPSGAHGQEAPQPSIPRVGVSAGAPTPIALDEAIRLALDQNNDVAVARLQQDIARQDVRAALGYYDPVILPFIAYDRATTPVTSSIGGAANGNVTQTAVEGGGQVTARSPWFGGDLVANFTTTRIETTNRNQRLNPQFPIATGVTYTQPLFRGLRFDADRRRILLSRSTATLTDAQLTRVLMDQLLLVERAYWDLAFASRNVDLQTTALTQACTQVQSNERQAQQGTLAPIDVIEAQTQVSNFEQNLATAEQTLTEAENRLKSLMLTDRAAPLWNRALTPEDLRERQTPALSLDAAIALALVRRPELAEFRVSVEQNAIDQRYFADLARPQIDLVGRYALAGLAGTFVPPDSGTAVVIPDFFFGGFQESLATVGKRRFPTVSFEIQMALPLRNRTASATSARTRLEGEQLSRQRQQLEQTIDLEVRNALQAVQSSQRRLAAAASSARNAQEQYESEQRRFESGLGTVFLVIERQTALVNAQSRELRARADVNQALADLDRAVGATLDRHGVQVAFPVLPAVR